MATVIALLWAIAVGAIEQDTRRERRCKQKGWRFSLNVKPDHRLHGAAPRLHGTIALSR
jgi:hypothetical protein